MDGTLAQPWGAAHRPLSTPAEIETWTRLTDGQLAMLARGGRPDAYGELVRRHQLAVYNIAYRLVGEREEALDLAQDAFVRAYAALANFDPARPFGPWINRVVTNLALNVLGRRAGAPLSLERSPAAESHAGGGALTDSAAEPERVYLAGERQALLRQAILALPPHYRAVVELRHFQDRSYDEIAAALAIPPSAVKSHLFRARRLLRQW